MANNVFNRRIFPISLQLVHKTGLLLLFGDKRQIVLPSCSVRNQEFLLLESLGAVMLGVNLWILSSQIKRIVEACGVCCVHPWAYQFLVWKSSRLKEWHHTWGVSSMRGDNTLWRSNMASRSIWRLVYEIIVTLSIIFTHLMNLV
jgi:hypothetical protein